MTSPISTVGGRRLRNFRYAVRSNRNTGVGPKEPALLRRSRSQGTGRVADGTYMHGLRRRVAFAPDRGMTLVEVVVALAVVGVVAAAFALLMVTTLGTSRAHEQRVTA